MKENTEDKVICQVHNMEIAVLGNTIIFFILKSHKDLQCTD